MAVSAYKCVLQEPYRWSDKSVCCCYLSSLMRLRKTSRFVVAAQMRRQTLSALHYYVACRTSVIENVSLSTGGLTIQIPFAPRRTPYATRIKTSTYLFLNSNHRKTRAP
jgi:hypothetical protein